MYKEFNANYDRITVSPISIYMALAMATGVAEKDAQEELVNLLGIPYEDIMEYTKYLYSRLNKERYDEDNKVISSLLLNNSIWLNNILDYKNEGLELLKNSFYADSYSVPFTTDNELANKAVGDFVYRSTKGLIDSKYKFDTSTLFLLINTLYLKDVWNYFGDELEFTKDSYNFKNKNNDSSLLMLLNDFKNAKTINITADNFFDYISNAPAVLEICIRNIRKLVDDKRTIIGQYNILNHYDFADLNLAQEYINCLKDGSIYQIVEFDAGPIPVITTTEVAGVSIKLGTENNLNIMKKCACITAYFTSKHHTGAITIYGPLRMKYRQVISFLKALVNNI